MSVTYDWSQFFNPLQAALQKITQQKKYQGDIQGLIGNPQFNPVTVTPQVAAPNLPQTPGATPIGDPARQAAYNAPPESFSGPVGQALGFDQASALGPMLKGLPPQIGIPLLLQSTQAALARKQELADKRIAPISDQEAQSLGLRPGGLYGRDVSGNIVTIQPSDMKSQGAIDQAVGQAEELAKFNNQLPMTAAQLAANRLANAQFAETTRHNKASEYTASHPFGDAIGTGPDGMPVTGNAFYDQLAKSNPGLANQVKAIATYRQAPPGRGTKQGIALLNLVNQFEPTYDATQFGAKSKARNDFTTGKNGNTVRSLNVAVQHLEQLGGLSAGLENGGYPALNRFSQYLAQQTGKPAPTNFDGVKQLVGDEIVKAVVGSGGGVHDRAEIANTISRASSPQQLAGIIKQYQGLLGGQLKGLKKQYEKSTGLNDFEDFLDPLTKTKLEGEGGQNGNPPTPVKVTGDADYNKLPSGSIFVGPDGVQRKKP